MSRINFRFFFLPLCRISLILIFQNPFIFVLLCYCNGVDTYSLTCGLKTPKGRDPIMMLSPLSERGIKRVTLSTVEGINIYIVIATNIRIYRRYA